MAGRIPQDFIDELVSRVDIVDVIDSRVPLKKAGRDYAACCPFHDEKTPSFTVSPSKQFYHCFGCGAHGTALGFLMDYEHMDFVEAVEDLAGRVGLEVPREGGGQGQGRDYRPLYEAMLEADRFFRRQLRQHPQAVRAVDYLKERGLSGEIAKVFGIGYAPPGWDNLRTALGGTSEKEARLTEVGLLTEKEGRAYDRFRDRVMFPIRDSRGRVVGFGGRVIGDDKPKYLNSPETPIFHKGRELYGLYEARQALRNLPRLLVVEGYMDVVSLAQYGIHYGVATLGTATTTEHLQRLFRATHEVVFCFDGDRAGREAAWRGLENALPLMREMRQVRFMFLPDGEDPDTLVRRIGQDAFEEQIANAVPLSEFFFRHIEERADLGSLDGRAKLVELARPHLSNLPSGALRQLMVETLAQRAGMDSAGLHALLEGRPATTPARVEPAAPRRASRNARPASRPSPIRHAVSLLLQRPELAQVAGDPRRFDDLKVPGVTLLRQMLELLQARPHLSTAVVLEHWRDTEEGRHLFHLARNALGLDEEADLEAEFRDTLELLDRRCEQQRRDARQRELQSRFATLSPAERQELRELLTARGAKGDSP